MSWLKSSLNKNIKAMYKTNIIIDLNNILRKAEANICGKKSPTAKTIIAIIKYLGISRKEYLKS